MLTDGAGLQFCCVMLCIWMRAESVGAVCLDNPSQAFIAGQASLGCNRPTNAELLSHRIIWWWVSTGEGKCG